MSQGDLGPIALGVQLVIQRMWIASGDVRADISAAAEDQAIDAIEQVAETRVTRRNEDRDGTRPPHGIYVTCRQIESLVFTAVCGDGDKRRHALPSEGKSLRRSLEFAPDLL